MSRADLQVSMREALLLSCSILVAVTSCTRQGSSPQAGWTAGSGDEATCASDADCRAGETCRGPDGCDRPATCRSLDELTCDGKTATLCGCDGVTFTADQNCPGRPVYRRRACEAPADCVRTGGIDCDEPRPSCPDGMTAEYADGCWHSCVPVEICRCTTDAQCPDVAPSCHTSTGRCRPS